MDKYEEFQKRERLKACRANIENARVELITNRRLRARERNDLAIRLIKSAECMGHLLSELGEGVEHE